MSEVRKVPFAEVLTPEVVSHHSLGPSAYTEWAQCPCWEGVKESSVFASRGTFAHLVVQGFLQKRPELMGESLPEGVELDDVQTGEWGANSILSLADGCEVHSEQRVVFSDELAEEMPVLRGAFGTVDAWFEDPHGQLHICDFKTFDRGEKDHTPQMSGYALFVCSNNLKYAQKPIFMHVIAGGTRKVITYQTNFETAAKLVLSLVTAHLDPHASPCPGNCCQYCAKAGSCPGTDRVVEVAMDRPVRWSKLHMADKAVIAEALKKILKAFDDEFKRAVEAAGGTLENPETGVRWQRYEKKPGRKCVSIASLGEELEKHNVPADTFIDHVCSVSQKSVVEALCKANPGMKAGDAEDIVRPFWQVPRDAKGTVGYKRIV